MTISKAAVLTMETVLKLNLIFVQIEVNVTKFLVELRFFLKFNLFLLPILLAGLGATSYVVWRQISTDAEQEALDKARVMLETATAMRTYTTKQIAPVLDRDQSRLEEADKSLDRILNTQIPNAMKKAIAQMASFRDQQAVQGAGQVIVEKARQEQRQAPEHEFLPQSIPFFAATEAFNYFRHQYPDYAYKEAALNPTNPRDRTSDWEMDVVDMFRNDASRKDFAGQRETPVGPVPFVSRPIRLDDGSCLKCHGAAENAPPELIKRYGADNGFGWALGDVVGAQIVSIPAQVAEDRAVAGQKTVMLWLSGIFAGLWAMVNGLVYSFYKRNGFAKPVRAQPLSL
jgi:hypothetical protein